MAIIDQYKYDLTRFTGITINNQTKNNIYYIRLCPDYELGDSFDTFVLQCPIASGESCRHLITQNSLDYKPRNPNNFSEGVIYFASSEPFLGDDKKAYKTMDIQFDLICDLQSTSSNVEFTLTFDESTLGLITARARTAAACPTIVPSPTPTPQYQPECDYVDRIDDNITFGINGNLNELNDGPFGIKKELVINGFKKILYYQPCERMLCPPLFNCSTNGYSSAWLCEINGNNRTCESYGVGVENVDFHPLDSSHLENGMLLHLEDSQTKKSVDFTLQCVDENNYPEGHIKWPSVGTISDNTLSLLGSAAEMCIRPIPTTTPVPENVCIYNSEIYDDKIVSMNLIDLNFGTKGWEKDVKIVGDRSHPNSKLLYQPCGSMICPEGVFCEGDEDAQVWLCYDDDDAIKTCIGYGLYKNNVTLELYIPGSLSSGLQAKYKGDMKRKANVVFLCDEYLDHYSIKLPETVTITSRSISFFVYSSQACPIDSILPTETLKPTQTQTKTYSPTSTEYPSQTPIETSTPKPSDGSDDAHKRAKITGGAIFLIVIAILIVLYLSIGLIVIYVKDGVVRIPNEAFWQSFGQCVIIGATYIFTCGKKNPQITLDTNYENLN